MASLSMSQQYAPDQRRVTITCCSARLALDAAEHSGQPATWLKLALQLLLVWLLSYPASGLQGDYFARDE
jgi:hypothetical protein